MGTPLGAQQTMVLPGCSACFFFVPPFSLLLLFSLRSRGACSAVPSLFGGSTLTFFFEGKYTYIDVLAQPSIPLCSWQDLQLRVPSLVSVKDFSFSFPPSLAFPIR
jgi:hypothetical protein